MSKREKQSYQYDKKKSILVGLTDQYELTQAEYSMLYSFYVSFAMNSNQSNKSKSFIEYGWPSNLLEEIINKKKQDTGLKKALVGVINFENSRNFIFTQKDDLKERFTELDLSDGPLKALDKERAVIGKTNADNKYLKLFYRIRDGLAHGKYALVFSSTKEKMVVIQDDDGHNVTARIIISLKSLLRFVEVIDRNQIILGNESAINEVA